jgi:transposase
VRIRPHWKDVDHAEAVSEEFRDDVVAVARKGEAPLNQIAKDFGISEGCLHNWLKAADVADGHRPGLTEADRGELRELKKRNRLLEQERRIQPVVATPSCLCRF